MKGGDKHFAVIDGEIHYLAEMYDTKGNFLMKVWAKPAYFDSMDEADEYLDRDESNTLHPEETS